MRCSNRALVVGLIVGLLSFHAHGQGCTEQDTVLQCWQRYMPAQKLADSTVQPSDVRMVLNDVETGADSSAGIASSVKNFLPLLTIAGLAGSGDSSTGNGLVTVDLNFLFPGLRDNGQLQAVLNTDPKIYEPLETALKTFDPNTDPEKLLGQKAKNADDYALVFTYGLSNKTKGRNLEPHRARFENLARVAIRSADTQGNAVASFARLTPRFRDSSLNVLTEDQLANFQSVAFSAVPDAARRADLLHAFEQFAKDTATTEKKIQENATALGVRDFAKLLSNQPQLHASLKREARDSFIGADALTVAVTYEKGFVNLNSFEAESDSVCSPADKQGVELTDAVMAQLRDCGAAIRTYVNRDDIRAQLEHGDRVSFSLAYSKVEDMNVALPNSTFRFHADGSKKVTASVAYGRLFGLKNGVADTRLDVEAKYEDASDDATRNDRFVATMTVTKKVGNLSIPFSLVYSNKSEFVVQPDAKLGAHIGIIFNTFGDPK